MRLRAMAKINLALDVLGKRPDGYHDVRMIMQTVTMYDDIELSKKPEPGIELRTNLPFIPTDEKNLAYRAARLLMDEAGVKEGLRIDLHKFIPVSAGLAGGSTDAAAVLVGVNSMFRLGLSMEDLMKRGAALGADVPFCVMRGTALAEGIGEKLTRLPSAPECSVLIAKPGISVSTKAAYEALRENEIASRPDIDGMIRSIREGDLYGVASRMENVFQPGIAEKHPVINELITEMEENGAVKAVMSGSGPTVFGIFDDKQKAEQAAHILRQEKKARTVYTARMFRVNDNAGPHAWQN